MPDARSLTAVGALWLLLAGSLAAAPRPQLTLDTLLADDASGSRPSGLAWRPGKAELSYVWDDGDGPALWRLDAATYETSVLLPAAALGAERPRDVHYLWSPDGGSLLLTRDGDLYLYAVTGGEPRRLTETEGKEDDPRFSPDGKRLSFVRDDELHLLDLGSGEERRLTRDGEPGVVFNGTTDWVYWEEIWGRDATGQWWSPDGSKIAYYHIDDREVGVYPHVDTSSLYPEVERQRYPKAGDTLPAVEVRVLDLASGRTVRLATHDEVDTYLARVDWHPDGARVAVQRLNRDQTRLDLLLCQVADGSCTTLLSEEQPTWVNLGDEFRFLPDGRFLWSAERNGWRQLFLYGADGALVRPLTPRTLALTSLDALNEEAGWFVFTAYSSAGEGLGASQRHVFLGNVATEGQPHRLVSEAGWNDALVSPTGYWVHTWSDADTPPRETVRHVINKRATFDLPYRPPSGYDPARLPQWEFLTIPGPEGSELPAQLLKPAGFDPAKKYPVITYHYGCPSSQVVARRWSGGRGLWHKMMAERGYLVFSVDNQGSLFFGKAGEDRMYRRFGELELAAQLAGVAYLKGLDYVDPDRIGLWGWSGGGANTLYSLFRSPGTWKAGISGAPVTDWRYYDAIWMERYLDRPQDNPEGYEASAPLTYAADLADALLLLHGTTDNNVHPQNTINLIDKLLRAERPFEVAYYPNQRHSLQAFPEGYQRDVYRRMTEFFDRHLRPDR